MLGFLKRYRDWFFMVACLCVYALLVALEPVLTGAEDCWHLPSTDASAGTLPRALGPGRAP